MTTTDTPNSASEITAVIKRIVNDQLVKVNTTQLWNETESNSFWHTMVWMNRVDPRRVDIIKAVKDAGWTVTEWGSFFAARRPKLEPKGDAARGEAFLKSAFPVTNTEF